MIELPTFELSDADRLLLHETLIDEDCLRTGARFGADIATLPEAKRAPAAAQAVAYLLEILDMELDEVLRYIAGIRALRVEAVRAGQMGLSGTNPSA